MRSVTCPLTVCGRQSPLNPRWDSPVVPGCRGTSHCTAPLHRRPRAPAGRGRAGGAAVGWGRSGPADGDARQVRRDGNRPGGGETQVQSHQQGGWRWDPEDRPCARRARFPVGQKYTLSTESQTPTPPPIDSQTLRGTGKGTPPTPLEPSGLVFEGPGRARGSWA